MNNPFLPDFDNLNALWTQLKNPDISGMAIQKVLQDNPKGWGLDVLDDRIGSLLGGNFDITEAGGSLFKKQQTWREMDKGVSEVCVLAVWQNSGALLGTAYPTVPPGATAPFDAHLNISGFHFGADIKTAATAASGVILERLEPGLEIWSKSKKIALPEIELKIKGSLDLRRLGPRWTEISRQFKAGLRSLKNDEVIIRLNCPLPGDVNDPADAGDLEIQVILLTEGANKAHSWAKPGPYLYKAKNLREPEVEFARSLLEKHAAEKGRHVDENGDKVPFILAYHRRGKPGDLSPQAVSAAMKDVSGPTHLLGVVYLDELASPATKAFHVHNGASFPVGVAPDDIRRALEK